MSDVVMFGEVLKPGAPRPCGPTGLLRAPLRCGPGFQPGPLRALRIPGAARASASAALPDPSYVGLGEPETLVEPVRGELIPGADHHVLRPVRAQPVQSLAHQ